MPLRSSMLQAYCQSSHNSHLGAGQDRAKLHAHASRLLTSGRAAGSGKTSLLSAALGLLQQLDGPEVELLGKVRDLCFVRLCSVSLSRLLWQCQPACLLNRAATQLQCLMQVAYVPQTAFIFNETVRNNILFGMPWDADKYQRVLEAANMGPDLALLQGTAC